MAKWGWEDRALVERAAIVAWLRGEVPTDYIDPQFDIGINLSDAIERGAHRTANRPENPVYFWLGIQAEGRE